jgi:hypothetical protein
MDEHDIHTEEVAAYVGLFAKYLKAEALRLEATYDAPPPLHEQAHERAIWMRTTAKRASDIANMLLLLDRVLIPAKDIPALREQFETLPDHQGG